MTENIREHTTQIQFKRNIQENFNPSTCNEVLKAGEPFYDWKNNNLYIGTYNSTHTALLPIKDLIPIPIIAQPSIDPNITPGNLVSMRADGDQLTDSGISTVNVVTTSNISNNVQKIKGNNVSFNNNATIDIVAGSNVSVSGNKSENKITISATDTTYSNATTSSAGLMSSGDKIKLDAIDNRLFYIEHSQIAQPGLYQSIKTALNNHQIPVCVFMGIVYFCPGYVVEGWPDSFEFISPASRWRTSDTAKKYYFYSFQVGQDDICSTVTLSGRIVPVAAKNNVESSATTLTGITIDGVDYKIEGGGSGGEDNVFSFTYSTDVQPGLYNNLLNAINSEKKICVAFGNEGYMKPVSGGSGGLYYVVSPSLSSALGNKAIALMTVTAPNYQTFSDEFAHLSLYWFEVYQTDICSSIRVREIHDVNFDTPTNESPILQGLKIDDTTYKLPGVIGTGTIESKPSAGSGSAQIINIGSEEGNLPSDSLYTITLYLSSPQSASSCTVLFSTHAPMGEKSSTFYPYDSLNAYRLISKNNALVLQKYTQGATQWVDENQPWHIDYTVLHHYN